MCEKETHIATESAHHALFVNTDIFKPSLLWCNTLLNQTWGRYSFFFFWLICLSFGSDIEAFPDTTLPTALYWHLDMLSLHFLVRLARPILSPTPCSIGLLHSFSINLPQLTWAHKPRFQYQVYPVTQQHCVWMCRNTYRNIRDIFPCRTAPLMVP